MDPRDFILMVRDEPWRLGWCDCIGIVARWLAECGYRDALQILPISADDDEVARILVEAGGLREAMAAGAMKLGLREVEEPQRGDVGWLRLRGDMQTAAIFCGETWAMRTPKGVGRIRPRYVLRQSVWRP